MTTVFLTFKQSKIISNRMIDEEHKPVTECGRWSGDNGWWPDAVCGTGSALEMLCGLKLLLLVVVELAGDVTLSSVIAARASAAAAGDKGPELEVKDGL